MNDRTICALYGKKALLIPYDARLILEKGLVNKIVTSKHFGIHSCPRYVDGRKEGVEKLAREFLRVTRESLRQQVQNSLETGGFSKTVDTKKHLTDTTYIDNVRWKFKNIRRPHGHSFKAVQVLQRSFENEDKFLIFDYNDGSEK